MAERTGGLRSGLSGKTGGILRLCKLDAAPAIVVRSKAGYRPWIETDAASASSGAPTLADEGDLDGAFGAGFSKRLMS
jgi:hypothetical protein